MLNTAASESPSGVELLSRPGPMEPWMAIVSGKRTNDAAAHSDVRVRINGSCSSNVAS